MTRTSKLLYVAGLPLLWVLYVVSFLVQRRSSRIAFGSLQDQFSDNSRYCFLALDHEGAQPERAWITGSHSVVEMLRARGFRAYRRWSIAGIAYSLTAGTYVTSGYLADVNFWCSGGCRHISLWHGIPLKKIERDITVGPLARQFRPGIRAVAARLALPYKFRKPNFIVSPCSYTDGIFRSAFGVEEKALLRSIYPRSTHLIDARRAFGATGARSRVVLYCPTWRDRTDACDVAALTRAIEALHRRCREQNFELHVKLHPNLERRGMGQMLGMLAVKRDLYDELAEAALVVTDYSSILFECLLADVPLMLFSYDGGEYQRANRDLYLDVQEVFREVWVDDPDSLRIERQLELSVRHTPQYKLRFGFYSGDAILPALAHGMFGSDAGASQVRART